LVFVFAFEEEKVFDIDFEFIFGYISLSLGDYFIQLKNIFMRNAIPFGYTRFGGRILVKLNVKISIEQANSLRTNYPSVLSMDNGRYGISLEGVINANKLDTFIKDLAILKLDAKIERLLIQKADLLDRSITNSDNLLSTNFDDV
jgi:hypothetical protein